MRTLLNTALVALLLVSLGTSAGAQDRIPWVASLDQAQQIAQQQNRLVLVHFWGNNCPPCQRLERTVFNAPEFIRAVSIGYVPVKVNGQQSPDLAARFGVDRWPTDVVLRPDGSVVLRNVCPQDTNQYIAMLDQVASHERLALQQPIANAATPQAGGQFVSQFQAQPGAGYGPGPQQSGGYGPSPAGGYNPAQQYAGNQGYPSNQYGGNTQAAANQPMANNGGGSIYQDTIGQTPPAQQAPTQPQYADNVGLGGQSAPGGQYSPGGQYGPGGQYAPGGQYPPNNQAAGYVPGPMPGTMPADQATAGTVAGNAPRYSPNGAVPNGAAANGGGSANQTAGQSAAPNTMQYNPHLANQPAGPATNAPAAPAGSAAYPQPAMDGQCPVTLVEQSQWVKGDRRWGAMHRNQLFLFAGPDQQRRFLANPDQYSPVLSGYDPVIYLKTGQMVPGRREHGVMFNQIYLFANENSLQEFWTNPAHFSGEVQRVMREADARATQNMQRR